MDSDVERKHDERIEFVLAKANMDETADGIRRAINVLPEKSFSIPFFNSPLKIEAFIPVEAVTISDVGNLATVQDMAPVFDEATFLGHQHAHAFDTEIQIRRALAGRGVDPRCLRDDA